MRSTQFAYGRPAKKSMMTKKSRPSLSEREEQVIVLSCRGLRNQSYCTPPWRRAEGTVKVHVHHIMRNGVRPSRNVRLSVEGRKRLVILRGSGIGALRLSEKRPLRLSRRRVGKLEGVIHAARLINNGHAAYPLAGHP